MMRPVALTLGLIALALSWSGLLPHLIAAPFSAHMAMHMGVVAVAAPLLALGVAHGRFDPARRFPKLFAAIPASVGELIAVWSWHAPALHHYARTQVLGLVLEQASFFAAGLWVWVAAVGGARRHRGERAAQGCIALVLTSMHMTLLGALLALPPRALYPVHAHAPASAHAALSALEDQHLGGAIMLVVGGVVYLSGGLALTVELFARGREPHNRPRPVPAHTQRGAAP